MLSADVEQKQARQHPVLTFRRRARGAMQPVLKATAAAITLGSGASLGPEGVAPAKGCGGTSQAMSPAVREPAPDPLDVLQPCCTLLLIECLPFAFCARGAVFHNSRCHDASTGKTNQMLPNPLFTSPTGPSVEIGKATAKGLGMLLKSKQRRMLALTAAGAGAGQVEMDATHGCPWPFSMCCMGNALMQTSSQRHACPSWEASPCSAQL